MGRNRACVFRSLDKQNGLVGRLGDPEGGARCFEVCMALWRPTRPQIWLLGLWANITYCLTAETWLLLPSVADLWPIDALLATTQNSISVV